MTGKRKSSVPQSRCEWADGHPLLVAYHDEEWGVPVHEDRKLFEFLVLDAAQAGLSWLTVLKKRENYRRAFDGFDPRRIARYGQKDVGRLLADPGIIRNRLKVASAVTNARAFLSVVDDLGTFDAYVWSFVDHKSRKNRWRTLQEIPARTEESDAMSADLRRRGFSFVGSTICYAFMQAAGLVNDHVVRCFRYKAVSH
jgi:DNA-3-methyladenine glycosylase I